MNILFLAPSYMGLYLPIVQELKKQGHKVFWIEDVMLPYDWNIPWRGWHDRMFRKIKGVLDNSFVNYWRTKINEIPELSDSYDILFCVNGCSFHPFIKTHLQKQNTSLHSVLYLWDNSSFYDYFHNAKYFDKVLTYDINDSVKYKVKLFPIYWQENKHKNLPIIYDLSMVGSNHDGRYDIAKAVKEQYKRRSFIFEGFGYYHTRKRDYNT